MKKTIIKLITGATIAASIAVACYVNVNDDLSISTNDAYATSGTCCTEEGSICMVNGLQISNYYWKGEGSCKSE